MFDLSKTPFNYYATLCILEMGMCLDFDLSFLGGGEGTYISGYRVYGYKIERSILSFTLQNGHL